MVDLMLASLPAPGLFERWVLTSPLLPSMALAGVGLVAFFVLARAGRVVPAAAALGGGLVIGSAMLVTGAAVQTDRELVMERTVAFVEAFLAQDTQAVESLLSERAVVMSGGVTASAYDRRRIVSLADESARYGVESTSIRWRGAEVEGRNAARTRCRITVTSGSYGMVPMVWEFSWRRGTDGEWRITALHLLRVYGEPVDGRGAASLLRRAG